MQRDVADIETATLTNVYDYASLTIKKTVETTAVDQDGVGIAYGPFTVEVTCTFLNDAVYGTGFGPGDPMTAQLSDDQSVTFTHLPAGAECTVEESDDKGAVSTSVVTTVGTEDPVTTDGTTAGLELVADPTPYTGEDPANSAEVVNRFDAGAPLGKGPFTFSVACAFNGDDHAYTGEVSLTRTGSQTTLTSDVISPLPVGAVCTIAETDDGAADRTPPPVTVTIPDIDANGAAQTVVAGFVNIYSAATVAVSKVVDGAGAARVDGDLFTIDVMCQLDDGAGGRVTVYSGSVDVAGGETHTVAAVDGSRVLLPLGAHCWAAEPDNGGANITTIDHGSWDDATVVEAASQVGAMRITVTNTFDALPAKDLPDAGGPSRLPVLLGALLLLAGAALVAAARRRREDG